MMTQEDINALKEFYFKRLYESNIGDIYYSDRHQVFICEIKQAYMPIEDFKNLLMQKARLLKANPCNKFIFDKRALKAFHQPSMEWYYAVWKPKMYEKFGLKVHRKLFTKEMWFRKCVEAGRVAIRNKYPDIVSHQMDIQVKESIRDAVLS